MHKTVYQGVSEPESGHQETARHEPLQRAFAELRTRQLTTEQVRRVTVERQGAIHIEVHESEKQRFFVYEAAELLELLPEHDPKIPLASELHPGRLAAEHLIISYRPGRRIVLGPPSGEHGNIIKGYKKHHAVGAKERYAIVQSACEQDGFDVPELLQYEADMDCLVIAKRSGHAPRITSDAVDVWKGIGSNLQRFQQSQLTDSLQEFNCRDELDVLDERARRFEFCMPVLPEQWQAGRERLEDTAADLPFTVKGLAHRDMHDGQFIVAGKTISLLDFDLACIADVALDAGNLLAHMKLRTLQQRQANGTSAMAACSRSFLDGLGGQEQRGFEHRLLFYQASTFYRLALLYALRPRWAHLTDALISEGKRCIDSIYELRRKS